MSEPLTYWLRIYFNSLYAISRIWNTLSARVVCWPFFTVGPRCSIHRTITVRQFLFRNSRLRIVLRGENKLGHHTDIQGSGTITFGERSFCGAFCVFGVNEKIDIGTDVMIAQAVTIRDTDHVYADRETTIRSQGLDVRPVVIGDDVWLGHGVTVLKGVTIGRGAVVAAGAVVTENIAPYTVVGGVPARIIGTRGKLS